ncbi:MAG: hypothetical protein WD645_01910, partial [Dehalococcoidia bacterium]
MGFSFGGGLGPFRARVGTRGVSGGVGPLSAGTSSRPRRSSQSDVGGLVGLVIGLLVLTLLGVTLAAVGPYLLGTWLAVQLGAGPDSLARAAVGWVFEALAVGLIVWGSVAWFKSNRENLRQEAERLQQKTERLQRQLIRALEEHPAGVPAAGLPDTEHLLFEMSDVSLIEPRSEHRGGAKVPTEVDRGRAVFSDGALRFVGSKTVTWKWRNLLGMQEGQDFLIFSVSNRQMASGIGADQSEHWAVEVATKWALAVHDGESLAPVRAALGLRDTQSWAAPNPETNFSQGVDDAAVGDGTRGPPGEAGATQPQLNSTLAATAKTAETAAERHALPPYASWDVNAPLPNP